MAVCCTEPFGGLRFRFHPREGTFWKKPIPQKVCIDSDPLMHFCYIAVTWAANLTAPGGSAAADLVQSNVGKNITVANLLTALGRQGNPQCTVSSSGICRLSEVIFRELFTCQCAADVQRIARLFPHQRKARSPAWTGQEMRFLGNFEHHIER